MTEPRVLNENKTAYLFGHFDSRGGSTLILAKRLSFAAKKYEEAFGMSEIDEEDFVSDPAGEDFAGRGALWVEGPEDPAPDTELLLDYGGEWAVLTVTSFAKYITVNETSEKTYNNGTVGWLLVKDTRPRDNQDHGAEGEPLTRTFGRTEDGRGNAHWYEAIEDTELGEDAFGVIFQYA